MNLLNISDPTFIKELDNDQLIALASDIRNFLYASVAKTGGHLSSNLGIVELTIAMHYVFNSPKDKFIFDVGHQSYIHKILTGRAKDFTTLRQFNGLSGFQKIDESIHDPWEAGHSSTSISAAMGMAIARDLNNEDYEILPVIGDGSIANGMSFEALNHLGELQKKVIIVFNDNNMSISNNVGGMSKTLNRLRVSKPYGAIKTDISETLSKNKVGTKILGSLTSIRNTVKKGVIHDTTFTDFGIEYLGPIDGHNIAELIKAFNYAKNQEDPIIIHIITKKGKGIKVCEEDTTGKWHGVGQFDPVSNELLSTLANNHISWSEIISNTLINLAKNDPDIVAISPAMLEGSKLTLFQKYYPNRTFDTGIAEAHATTMAAGLAISNKKPFLSIYSTFLQRVYDQINHDIARMNLPVVIGIDRAGIVGEDGDTHQGVFDISMLYNIPNLLIVQPKDQAEAQDLLYSSFEYKQPIAIRYPRGSAEYIMQTEYSLIEIGSWTKHLFNENIEAILITYGPSVDRFISRIQSNNFKIGVINARFIKPLDIQMLLDIQKLGVPIFTYENEMLNGGLSSMINDFYNDRDLKVNIIRFGIDDEYLPHGSIISLRKHYNLDINHVLNTIKDNIERK